MKPFDGDGKEECGCGGRYSVRGAQFLRVSSRREGLGKNEGHSVLKKTQTGMKKLGRADFDVRRACPLITLCLLSQDVFCDSSGKLTFGI